MGISTDDAATQKRFKESLKLPFPLLPDPEGKVVRAYGVARGFPLGGYAKRVTFVIGQDGLITHVEHDKLEPDDSLQACPLHKH